jgi:hypothetical protein
MKHRIDVFSPETYQRFSASDRQLAGEKARYRMLASEVDPGDLLIGYVTRLSRWCGVLEVTSKAFEDSAPRFSDSDDPYILRFRVKPLVWLSIEESIPVHEDFVWSALSFTQNHSKSSSLWTGPLRTSLTALGSSDGAFLVKTLRQQAESLRNFPLDPRAQRIIRGYRVNRADGAVSVTVPDDLEDGADASEASGGDVRESIKVQALLVRIGAAMHMRVWIPVNDRAAVVRELGNDAAALLDNLPLNYDSTTIDTIERIDVLWIKGRSIVRAFEVEHTTSIYSGLLRMGDLLSLQPNMDIRLHIVAPDERRTKVMNEIRRPIFSLIERRPLAKTCSFLSYDAVRDLNNLPHLEHTSDSILQEFEEFADE